MAVTLRPFLHTDLPRHVAWCEAIDAGRFMSRVFPMRFDDQTADIIPHFCWYVIVNDGADVGSLWLEKENSNDETVQLGILIGHEELWGKGIGRKAIEQAILKSRVALPVSKVLLNVRKNNIRAQACYTACGFHVVNQGVKTNQKGERIEFTTMEREIPNNRVNQTHE